MSKTLEEKLKELERQLALKKAYLDIVFSFPKNSKLPQDVRDQVTNELRDACIRLAENLEAVRPSNTNTSHYLTEEEIQVLKQVANAARGKISTAIEEKQIPEELLKNPNAPKPMTGKSKPLLEPKEALVLTLDNAPKEVKTKMGSMEKIMVLSLRDDKAFVRNKIGQTFFIPLEDLDFNLEK